MPHYETFPPRQKPNKMCVFAPIKCTQRSVSKVGVYPPPSLLEKPPDAISELVNKQVGGGGGALRIRGAGPSLPKGCHPLKLFRRQAGSQAKNKLGRLFIGFGLVTFCRAVRWVFSGGLVIYFALHFGLCYSGCFCLRVCFGRLNNIDYRVIISISLYVVCDNLLIFNGI